MPLVASNSARTWVPVVPFRIVAQDFVSRPGVQIGSIRTGFGYAPTIS